jgi:hypothetical protein
MQSQKYEIYNEIRYVVEKKMSITKIHKITVNTTGDYAASCTPVVKLSVKFMGGWLSIEGNPKCGTPSTESIEKLVIGVHIIMHNDHWLDRGYLVYIQDILMNPFYDILI